MQPDTTLDRSARPAVLARIPQVWRVPLTVLAAAVAALILATWREWGEMFHQWWNIDTYNHILLIPFFIVWLLALRAQDIARLAPRPWLPGLALVGLGLALWLVGRVTGINLIAHAGAVGAVQAAVVAVLGLRLSLLIALPLGLFAFMVPFGDELIAPLQTITAEIAIALTHASGVPAVIDGIYIDTPVGLFIVAEACSGVKFLIAMVTLAVLVCFTRFESWTRRAVFMGVSIIVPVLANGVRAWGTIYIAQSQGVEFAAGFDHIFYGWIFFAIVVAVVLAAAWRFFEREPEESGWTAAQLAHWRWLERIERTSARAPAILGAIAALALSGAVLAAIFAPAAVG
jgi:exosortase A